MAGEKQQGKGLVVTKEKLDELDKIAEDCRGLVAFEHAGSFTRGIQTARAITTLKAAITPEILNQFMDLQGNKLGFLTDKDRPKNPNDAPGYHPEVVKNVMVEGLLRGAYCVGNEINIISGQCYLALNYFKRKLLELPGLTDLELHPGVPMMNAGNACVPYVATWNYNGKPMRIDRIYRKFTDGNFSDERIPVRVNAGMGVDAILGKAERKMRAMILARCTGTIHSDEEPDTDNAIAGYLQAPPAGGSRADELAGKLNTAPEGDTAIASETEADESGQGEPVKTEPKQEKPADPKKEPEKPADKPAPKEGEETEPVFDAAAADMASDLQDKIDDLKTAEGSSPIAALIAKSGLPKEMQDGFMKALQIKVNSLRDTPKPEGNPAQEQTKTGKKKLGNW